MGANKKEGQVKLERSPVKEAKVFKKEEKLPCWSAGILSRVLSEEVILNKIKKMQEKKRERIIKGVKNLLFQNHFAPPFFP